MSALRFRSLTVRRMPGIDDGGFELRELAPGVNVVYGPNGTGKTTTARALESLLWPGRSPGAAAWVWGSFELDGAGWSVELDAGRARLQRNGEPTTPPHALPVEASGRYRLELKELLETEDASLARAIGLESAGGYDVAEAAKALSPRRTASRPKREVEELKAARERLKAARAVQDQLQEAVSGLASDEKRLSARPAVEAQLSWLRLATEHASRRLAASEARAGLGGYHPIMALLVGDEAGRCAELQSKLAEARERAHSAEDGVLRKREEIDQLAMPVGLLEADHFALLVTQATELDRIEAEIRGQERSAEEALARLDGERERLEGAAVSDVARVKLSEVTALSSAVKEMEAARARRRAVEEEMKLLASTSGPGNRARLERGAFLLQQWLRAPDARTSDGRRTRLLAVAASLLLVIGGLALTIVHPIALLLSAAGAILLGLTLRRAGRGERRSAYEESFAEMRFAQAPATWRQEDVQACLDELLDQQVAARYAEEGDRRRQQLEPLLAEARAREDELLATVTGAAAALGLTGIADGALPWVLERVSQIQNASAALESATAGRARGLSQRGEALARANLLLQESGLETAADTGALRGRLHALDEKARTHARIVAELERCRSELLAAERRQEELGVELQGVLDRLGIGPGDEPRLAEWCGERDAYVVARREAETLEAECGRMLERLRASTGFEPGLLERSAEEIELEATRVASELSALDAVQLRVLELRGEVARATRGHEVEDALAEVDRCDAALRALRDRDARAAIAAVLVEHVERKSRNEQRPAVFHRASALLTRITRGRYELVLDDREEAAFRAYDTHRERSQPLEELSGATRLQLLLAVRVAFVELHEGGIQLPLLMDETLANSDDERAAAIMDTVLALAAGGRQIFYFTAQPDEVRKWRAALSSADGISGGLFDLAEARRLERRLDPAQLDRISAPLPTPPAPNGLGHAAYGRILRVPRVEPLEAVGALHLWYLIEDPEELFRMMVTSGADRWGSLRALLNTTGSRLLPDGVPRRVEALAECANSALLRMRVGRGKAVDRHGLASSGVISTRFLDEVSVLADAVDGDAVRLLEELGRKAVPNFQQKNVQVLRDFLEQEGYLDTRPSILPSTVRMEVLSDSARALQTGAITLEEIDRLLVRLRVGTGPDPVPEINGSLSLEPYS